ncbi:DNA cytosine methyltransferase [Pseudomonas aeruginosa]|uniref:DNA cytosine methyltransferase n=1 Tax=Pseudomonas aeruginosa TaxID=287 RepID=UPI000F7F642F|nr:DNA cytosine methyltransferase [Pseudomonas aeruginosa]RTB44090.1 DNA cytosine methyltransferase [Pseudomonas aeruginosa]
MHYPSPTYGSVCSGIEAVSLGWHPLGFAPAWFAEIEAFPCAVLAHRYPDVPNLGDMTKIAAQVRAELVAAPYILVGGTPCQSFSIAGARQGISDPRGALTISYVELANVIDEVRQKNCRPPATIVWENVPGILTDRENAFGMFLGALAGESCALEPAGKKWTNAGYVSGPRRRIAWRILDAQHFGVAQRRRRVFLVASGRNDLDPAEILFESESLRGSAAPGFSPWQEIAGASAPGAGNAGSYAGVNPAYGQVTLSFGGGKTSGPINVAACLNASPGPRHDFDVETFMVQSVSGSISHTLDTANGGKGCGEDGTGKGVPLIAQRWMLPRQQASFSFSENARGDVFLDSGHGQVLSTMTTGGGKPGQGYPAILVGPSHAGVAELWGNISPTLRACSGVGDQGHVLTSAQAHFRYEPSEVTAQDWSQWRVRRLMPVECERLQGMPDNWTLVPYRGKLAADAPRYKALGNSMAVPCVRWIGERLRQAMA